MSESDYRPDSGSDSDDDIPALSEHAAFALQEFLNELKVEEEREKALVSLDNNDDDEKVKKVAQTELKEDWQLSQFWYDTATCMNLEKIVLGALSECDGKTVCCLSSPTLFKHLMAQESIPEDDLLLFEYDRRFAVFKNFHFWDLWDPLQIDPKLKNQVDVILADPPFLNEGNPVTNYVS